MKRRLCIGKDFDSLIVTSGATQIMELVTKVLCNEGDSIAVEDPSFIGSLNAFRSYGVNLRGVPVDADGINIAALEETLKSDDKIRFLYTIPNFQNPAGCTMSLEKRKAVYDLACKYDIVVLEDNPYGDLRVAGEDLPCIKSFDEIDAVGHRVVHGGEKFNKSVLINDEVKAMIKECYGIAPLHNPVNMAGIDAIDAILPNVPQVAVFDTAFHQTMPTERHPTVHTS